MSTWTVYDRDIDSERWLNHTDGEGWVADDETTFILKDPDFGFPITPTGPWQQGVPDELALYRAALYLIPSPEFAGDRPQSPAARRSSTPGVVY
ncbi:hypothetical protein BFN03_13310 [Rhodococcus sp. WMMA185]|uniref:hypothetical protein n=1 Tax=Rhodococcus sp. WMMA185 TaxID=679318 RepID=UPI000878EF83|nr:hypothetical protein [Rhodococcus sp. WMMA185]AOW93298.1 hypothetical protein BFN03_13310 [Rhodococcus sp. WMMA185]